jgi:hypothetical protein
MAQGGFKLKSKAPAKKSKVNQKQKSKQLSKGRKAFSAKGRKAALAKQDAETSKAINRKNEVTVAARAVGSGNTFFLNDIKEAGKKEIGKKNAELRKKESKSVKMSERLTQQLNKLK